ncbi:MAG: SMP-30/gluconolactonase/LRE family protein [Saprospiraceae bacterium]|nr:SMP-30/gluconolactonase/LRE family protein [Saprospiraceae bacterium]
MFTQLIPGLLLLLASTSLNCQEGELYQAKDFTKVDGFTSGIEGPAVDKYGNIYAVNFAAQGTIGMVLPDGTASLWITLPEGSIGNGIRIDNKGLLYVADYTNHNVLQIHPQTKATVVYMHNGDMNQPNDLAICRDGTLFASDPNWKEGTGNLWRVDTDGRSVLMEENMGTSNGVEVSPDEKTLYVNESVQRKVWAYDLDLEKNISNKRIFHEFADFGMDGMRCDTAGNLFITRHGKGTVAILSTEGKLLQEVVLQGKKPSNIAFGGKGGRTCYVTLQDRGCFETFRSQHPGRAFDIIHSH